MEKTFGENLKFLRMERGITQRQFAKLMNTSQQRVSEWECGKVEPTLYNIIRILDIFGISFEDLIENVKN